MYFSLRKFRVIFVRTFSFFFLGPFSMKVLVRVEQFISVSTFQYK